MGRVYWSKINVDPFLWVAGVSTGLSGFFALTGFALRSYRRVHLEEAFAGATNRLDSLEADLKGLQLTASLGRGLANIMIVVALGCLLQADSSVPRVAAAIALSGAIIAIFGVAIPSAWAHYAGEAAIARTYVVLMVFRYALWPVTAVMLALDLPIARLAGVQSQTQSGETAKEEILQAAVEGQAEGAVDAEEVQMIESVMEFGETQAGEIMTPRTDIFALPIDTPLQEAIGRIVAAGHTRVPVYEGDIDHIVGILYAKDLLKYVGSHEPVEIKDALRKCYFVPETKLLDDLLKEFKARKVHLACLLDEYGGTAGLVSIEDVVEEIVGEITDEYDSTADASLHKIDETTSEVDGRFYIDELNDALKLSLPEDEDYDTIAGLVFSQLGYVPIPGETLQAHGAKFTVLEADERKITRIKVEITSDETAE